MKSYPRVFATVVLLAALSLSISAVRGEGVSITTLPTGMKVIVREGHSINLAAVDIWVKTGSVNETPPDSGVSHFVEHMIFKATPKYGPGQIDREIEGLGAELNGGTSRDWMHFYTTVASEYLPIAMEALADAMMNAQFRTEDIEKERQVILDEIARAESDHSRRALDMFYQVAFEEHPYRLPPAGMRESIQRLGREEMVAYYNRYFVPENIRVVVAGDVSRQEVVALVKSAFQGFIRHDGQPSTIPPDEAPLTSPRVRSFRSASDQQGHLVFGYRVPGSSDLREICTLDVILAILGDENRGRISAALNAGGIRFRKVSTDYVVQKHPTVFSVLVSSDSAGAESSAVGFGPQADKVSRVLLAEFRRLAKDPVPAGELVQAKRLVEGSDLFEQETFSGQAKALGFYESVASCDFALRYTSVVRRITPDDIASVAAKYFGAENYCLAIIEPAAGGQE